jgi:PmbA protein
MTTDSLLDLATRVAGWAKDGEQVEAYVSRRHDTEVVVYGAEIESLSSADTEGVGIRIIKDDRQGFAYAGSLDEDIIAETLDEARDNAGFGTPDPHLGLAEPDGVPAVELDLWRDAVLSFPTDKKVEIALDLEKRVLAGDSRIRGVEAAEFGDYASESAIATNTGIASSARRTGCYVAVVSMAGEGDETQTGYGVSVGRSPDELDVDRAVEHAISRSVRMLGAKKPKSSRVTVVFTPQISATLLGILSSTLSGEAVLKGRSLFADRMGEEVAASDVTLTDDPTDPDAYGASSHDAEGLASRRNVLIENGVLRSFLYDTYAGRRAGVASTASAVRGGFKSGPGVGARAFAINPGQGDEADVLRTVGNGLLVDSVTGVHSGVNTVSGDFSVGASGLMVRGGEIAEPVREFTIASTLQRMLLGIVAIGADVERLPSMATGLTLAIADVSMSGA